MRYKPDWPEARERLTALWEGWPLDRPCIAVTAPSGANEPMPPARSLEQRWIDPAWNARAALATMRNTWWGGEAVPSYLLMCGWLVCFGGKTSYAETTIWHERRPMDFGRPPAFAFDPADPQVRIFARAYRALEREGVVVTIRGKGVYVSDAPRRSDRERALAEIKETLDGILVDAFHKGITADEVRKLLEGRIENLNKKREG